MSKLPKLTAEQAEAALTGARESISPEPTDSFFDKVFKLTATGRRGHSINVQQISRKSPLMA